MAQNISPKITQNNFPNHKSTEACLPLLEGIVPLFCLKRDPACFAERLDAGAPTEASPSASLHAWAPWRHHIGGSCAALSGGNYRFNLNRFL